MIVLEEKLYTSEETAEILGVNPRTLYRYLKNGDIQAETKTKSGTFRFTRTQIYKYLYPDKYSQIIELLKSKEKSKYVYLDHSQVSSTKQNTEQPKDQISVNKTQPVAEDSVDNQSFQPSKSVQIAPASFAASRHLDLNNQTLTSANFAEPKTTPPVSSSFVPPVPQLLNNTPQNQPQTPNPPSIPSTAFPSAVPSSSTVMSTPVDKDKLEQIRHERSHKNLNDELESLQTSIQGNSSTLNSNGSLPNTISGSLPGNQSNNNANTNSTDDWKYFLNSNKDILQLSRDINSLGTETGRKYASTMKGGLSLHQDLEEFNLVHFYVEKEDLNWWVNHLELSFARPEDANICLIPTDNLKIFDTSYKLRGLNVVSDDQLIQDLMKHNEKELAKTLL